MLTIFTNNKSVYLESVNNVYVIETKGFVRIIISVMSPLKNASSNSLFQIKKIRIKNATKFIIGNLNII